MEMIQYLEADKEQLMSALVQAGTPESAQNVLDKEWDRLLLRYNEECAEERVRDTARAIVQAARMMAPLISAAGETRVWTRKEGTEKTAGTKVSLPVIASLAGGILFVCGAIIGLAVSAGDGLSIPALLSAVPAVILGGGLLFWAGRMSLDPGSGRDPSGKQQVEIRVNPDRIYSCMRAAVLSADKSLAEAQEAVRYESSRLSASVGNGISPEEAEFFAGMLESVYSIKEENPDDPAVREMLSMTRYYLHRKQVETVNFGDGKREWFELLPGRQAMTLRPALVKDGTLVKKGLAVAAE